LKCSIASGGKITVYFFSGGSADALPVLYGEATMISAHISRRTFRIANTLRCAFVFGALSMGCYATEEPEARVLKGPSAVLQTLDIHRSLIVTDQIILDPAFSFKTVMDQITATSGTNVTSLQLFQQWWSTQNPGPGSTARCDDELTGGVPSFNGFPWACPREEGAQASVNPFTPATNNPNGYLPIALTNRFDLAPTDGANCGEYRIIYARNSGITNAGDRNLVIFEAVLPNPDPSSGLEACRPVAQFWADLSSVNSVSERTAKLQQFYFSGIPGFEAVIRADHFGARLTSMGHGTARGQIRSNQFMESPWLLREWRLVVDNRGLTRKLRMVPVTVKTNPWGADFNTASANARSVSFRSEFVEKTGQLAAASLMGISVNVDDNFNTGQSVSQFATENDYGTHFDAGVASDPSFSNAIAQELNAIGNTTLTPRNVVDRALTQSCAGCHRLSDGVALGGGLVWPASPIRFVHVTERATEPGPDGLRWAISAGLRDVFLPHRRNVLEQYLATQAAASSFAPTIQPRSEGEAFFIDPGTILTAAQALDPQLADLAPTERVVFVGLGGLLGGPTTAEIRFVDKLDALSTTVLGGGSGVH
jgi:hypothetical protein